MSEDKERVTFVQYGFSSAALIADAISPSHKTEESVEKFSHFCEEELHRTYPNAEIEVACLELVDSILPESMQTLVRTWNGFQESEDMEEAMWVNQICERIYKSFDWLVPENLISVVRSSSYLVNSHPAVVRWACAGGLIKGPRKPDGLWNIPLEALQKVKDYIELVASENFIGEATQKKQMVACYFETVKDLFLTELPEKVEVLIITQNGFGISLFKPNTSYVLLSKNNSQIHISVEHFVDVEGWSDSRWSYSAYAKALIAQATRLGIDGSLKVNEQNGSDVMINGVSFHFLENLNQDTTLQILLDKVLLKLSNLIDATKLSLAGGLIWDDVNDEIYQKDEIRFSKEVLEPLLHYMGFNIVRNTHGNRGEHGRDFICAYQTPFNQPIYFGLQAKRGSISGNANSQITSILKQIEDAFIVPYTKEPGSSRTEIHISCMILAISGEFTDDALDKIYAWVPKYQFPIGSLFLWDKPKIKSFISKFFPPNREE